MKTSNPQTTTSAGSGRLLPLVLIPWQFPLAKVATLWNFTHMDQETETETQFDPKRLYSSDVEELINWDGLAEFEPEDIRLMIPLIMERLIKLI
jgi:hypothetical protein